MNTGIDIGKDAHGTPVMVDVEELLATRLLVQGNSGSGKSHLLRRILEQSAGLVQQVIIDPEGDFVSLADHFDHVVVDGGSYSAREIEALAGRIRQHRASVVLALEELEVEQQIRCAAQFLTALFDAPREHWFPALVVVDEAQMFAPAAAGEMAEDTRRMTLSAMTNLMCRGRKRGLAGIVATQRLAKLAKNVAAEASNFLMGRTFLDIDMQRAADLLGMDRKQAERIRDLQRGHFLGLGPAVSRRPVAVHIGEVKTGGKNAAAALTPLPQAGAEEMGELLHADLAEEAAEKVHQPPPPPPPAPPPVEELAQSMASRAEPEQSLSSEVPTGDVESVLREMAAEEGATFRPAATLFRDFATRCRQQGVASAHIDMPTFRRRFAFASAGVDRLGEGAREAVERMADGVADDVLAPYLAILVSAALGSGTPDEDHLARVYGTSSPGRIRRLLEHLEKTGLIAVHEDFGGDRTITVPGIEDVVA
ncbi:ATP-binding protein [Aurantiacibacter poecillastricola]|uniref:ATP-binding protein n=1 Tax=Aurantiacibacter poecillastricola TaxID=3064385 RepID=UPI00273D840E|nr:ATP-binding protein [Aurantiacibacter sp. 219JJ12-13]MDP5260774.1 ATP-binding protein [Aurantiacibacter sp. 219JJ12-13]